MDENATVSSVLSDNMVHFRLADVVLPESEDESVVSALHSTLYKARPSADHIQDPIDFHDVVAGERESVILEDLLSVLLGGDGEYLTANHRDALVIGENLADQPWAEGAAEDISVALFETLETPVAQIVKKLLRVAKYHLQLDAFTETFSRFGYGLVNHALCGGIQALLKEYYILVAQLEHQLRKDAEFSVHKFWFYFQPTLKTMRALYNLVTQILGQAKVDKEAAVQGVLVPGTAKGGYILGLLERTLVNLGGDFEIKQTYSFLLACASVPYISLLYGWIHNGEITDRYGEFMVEERATGSKEEVDADHLESYWERRYALRPTQTPLFLAAHAEKILLAGKFLNVARECKGTFEVLTPLVDARAVMDSGQFNINVYVLEIERAYDHANRTLLDLLFREHHLVLRLRSLKRYFFLDQSDFITHFFDLSFAELSKPLDLVSPTKAQSILELALRNPFSITRADPYNEDIRVSFTPLRLTEHLRKVNVLEGVAHDHVAFLQENPTTPAQREIIAAFDQQVADRAATQPMLGFEALALEYRIKFPLSLVLSKNVVTKYQLIFRHLVAIKRAESLLVQTWADHANFRKRYRLQPPWHARVDSMRLRLLSLIRAASNYIGVSVLQQNQGRLVAELETVTTVAEVFRIHAEFLDACLREAMLTIPKLLEVFNKLIHLCITFAEFCRGAFETRLGPSEAARGASEALDRYELILIYYVKMFVVLLRYHAVSGVPAFLGLATMLDFNLHYTNAAFYPRPPLPPKNLHPAETCGFKLCPAAINPWPFTRLTPRSEAYRGDVRSLDAA
ncbi:gamma tubulin complex Spc97/GCP2 subunit Alp4 [Massospora cicadina]|nr:gamma tubulin complex Spc97/GCP2 subunit Alp4 [Massospora cicadina]